MTENTRNAPSSAAAPAAGSPEHPHTNPHSRSARPGRASRWLTRLLAAALVVSSLLNVAMYVAWSEYRRDGSAPVERFHSGDRNVRDKIALIEVKGTISPPFTGRIVKAIEKAADDDRVKGIVLTIDSPGGLVADSHRIYHKLRELNAKKPIVVSMKRMAASGGYYVAMGSGLEGKIYAEPTTWTGSIGVIIPRYNASLLSEKLGIASDPLKTGEFKDALSPFRELTESEREVWHEILDESFQRFVNVIAENRPDLDYQSVRTLATGQIYTAEQARKNGLVDEIGYEEDAIEYLQERLSLDKARVVRYQTRPSLLSLVTGTIEARQPESEWRTVMEATVPQVMYYCSWGLGVPGW
jgi:protease IV